MGKIIVDDSLRSKLNGLDQELEFCDETGRKLGQFLPTEQYRALLNAWASAVFSEEELKRAEIETGGRPLAEIWKSLTGQ
jgi:hypothetical protein